MAQRDTDDTDHSLMDRYRDANADDNFPYNQMVGHSFFFRFVFGRSQSQTPTLITLTLTLTLTSTLTLMTLTLMTPTLTLTALGGRSLVFLPFRLRPMPVPEVAIQNAFAHAQHMGGCMHGLNKQKIDLCVIDN